MSLVDSVTSYTIFQCVTRILQHSPQCLHVYRHQLAVYIKPDRSGLLWVNAGSAAGVQQG